MDEIFWSVTKKDAKEVSDSVGYDLDRFNDDEIFQNLLKEKIEEAFSNIWYETMQEAIEEALDEYRTEVRLVRGLR